MINLDLTLRMSRKNEECLSVCDKWCLFVWASSISCMHRPKVSRREGPTCDEIWRDRAADRAPTLLFTGMKIRKVRSHRMTHTLNKNKFGGTENDQCHIARHQDVHVCRHFYESATHRRKYSALSPPNHQKYQLVFFVWQKLFVVETQLTR